MRVPHALLLVCSLLVTNAAAQTASKLENTTAAQIRKLGGTVRINPRIKGKPVVLVALRGAAVTDAKLVLLKGLTELQVLDLSGTQVTDAGLEHLKGLTSLQTLNLKRTKVTDAGLVHLKGLTKLQRLWLTVDRT